VCAVLVPPQHFNGVEEAVYRNVQACKDIAKITKSSFGPNGMNKMIINHLDRLFVTNDAATIIRELEVEHPAAKLLVLASQQQEHEVGDGTNFVIVFAAELLKKAEGLLRMGLSPAEILAGYEKVGGSIGQLKPLSQFFVVSHDFLLSSCRSHSLCRTSPGCHTCLVDTCIWAVSRCSLPFLLSVADIWRAQADRFCLI
jgi:hypothetical protein